jgi:hypothetical protein
VCGQRPGWGEQYARGEQGEIASASSQALSIEVSMVGLGIPESATRPIWAENLSSRRGAQSRPRRRPSLMRPHPVRTGSQDNRPFSVPRCLRMSLGKLFRQNRQCCLPEARSSSPSSLASTASRGMLECSMFFNGGELQREYDTLKRNRNQTNELRHRKRLRFVRRL